MQSSLPKQIVSLTRFSSSLGVRAKHPDFASLSINMLKFTFRFTLLKYTKLIRDAMYRSGAARL